MMIEPDMAYRALVARDARFDGHMFVGVTSTGVYCRPICRVRTPQQRNCRFFDSAAQAEAAQFRPCMKCRPEMAPQAPWRKIHAQEFGQHLGHFVAALAAAHIHHYLRVRPFCKLVLRDRLS